MVARTEARMASVLLACLLALLAPLRVAAQCTPLGVSVEFVAPSDSEHVLVTDDAEVARNTALCHVNCLNWVLSNITNSTNSTGAVESPKIEDIIELDCTQFKQYLDCRYGCVLQSQGQSEHCGTTCRSRCESLCGFRSCFSSDDYVCGVGCDEGDCSNGCGLYDMHSFRSEDLTAPVTAPDLVLINGTHAYEVVIPDDAYEVVVPEDLRLFDTPSLVFRIEDRFTPEEDYAYQWMVDVEFDFPFVSLKPPMVDLAAYSCRIVSVSYAFATLSGLSWYSTATVVAVPGNGTIATCLVPQLEDSQVHVVYVPDERAGFFTHVVWNVTWNLTTCQERVTDFFVALDPQENDCGESLWRTVDNNTSSVSLRSTVEETLNLPCTYKLTVQVYPDEQGSAYTKRITVSSSDFVLPELEIVGCPVMYKPKLNTYEVNFQWRTPFSRALLSFINRFQITAFQIERRERNNVILATFSPEFELVNINYDPLHSHIQTLPPFEDNGRFYRIGIEVVWKNEGILSALSHHCDTVDTPAPPPDPIQNIFNTSSDVLDVLTGKEYQTVEVFLSFMWDEPELNYNDEPIQQYQAHLALEPLDPDSEGEATVGFSGRDRRGALFFSFEGIGLDEVSFIAFLQMRSYQFQNLPSNWSEPLPILIALSTAPPAGMITLTYPQTVLVTEGSVSNIRLSIEGQAIEDVPFQLLSLTYQQFETLSGEHVADIFSDVPISASSSDFTLLEFDFIFRNSSTLLTAEYVLGLCGIAVDDQEVEEEEGFILYFNFDQTAIHPDDYNRLQIGNAAILIRITDDDIPIDLYFINNTPELVGGSVSAEFAANRPGLVISCHLIPLDEVQFCTNGTYRRTDIPPGDYTLRVIARDPVRGDRKAIHSSLHVNSGDVNDPYCFTYLINRGWRVEGRNITVEFTATGVANGFLCTLDRTKHTGCSSPYTVTDLSPGTHHLRILPLGCGSLSG